MCYHRISRAYDDRNIYVVLDKYLPGTTIITKVKFSFLPGHRRPPLRWDTQVALSVVTHAAATRAPPWVLALKVTKYPRHKIQDGLAGEKEGKPCAP